MLPNNAQMDSPRQRRSHGKSGKSGMGPQQPRSPLLQLMVTVMADRQRTESDGGGAPAATTAAQLQQVHVGGPAPPPATAATPGHRRNLWQRVRANPWLSLLLFVLVLGGVAVALGVGLQRAAFQAAQPTPRPGMQPPQGPLGARLDTSGAKLVFAEDWTWFNASTWNVQLGDGADYGLESWGNHEEQCYTASTDNLDIVPHPDYPALDGVLRIRPVYSATPQQCANRKAPGSSRQWTSAKVDTKNKFAFSWHTGQQVVTGANSNPVGGGRGTGVNPDTSGSTSGRRLAAAGGAAGSSITSTCSYVVVESRMRLPMAAGRWSALWMMPQPRPCPTPQLGECGSFGPWPASGEIDVLEQVNTDARVLSTVHYTDSAQKHQWSSGWRDLPAATLSEWSIYQLVWNCSALSFYVNAQPVHQVLKEKLAVGAWPFDEPFFLILNTAVGGWLTRDAVPDKAASAPFLVDYVRVYAAPGQ